MIEMIILMSKEHDKDARFQFQSKLDIRNPVKIPLSTIIRLDPWWTCWWVMIILMRHEYDTEVVFQISSRLVSRNPILHFGVGSLVDMDKMVGDYHLDKSETR